MDTFQKVFDIIMEVPELGLWGITVYFLFILLKAASWLTALTIAWKLLITHSFGFFRQRSEDRKVIATAEALTKEVISNNEVEVKRLDSEQKGIADQTIRLKLEAKKEMALDSLIEEDTYASAEKEFRKLLMVIRPDGGKAHGHDVEKLISDINKFREKK